MMQPMERFPSAKENNREASEPPLPVNSIHCQTPGTFELANVVGRGLSFGGGFL
jgi:hypothetical protein